MSRVLRALDVLLGTEDEGGDYPVASDELLVLRQVPVGGRHYEPSCSTLCREIDQDEVKVQKTLNALQAKNLIKGAFRHGSISYKLTWAGRRALWRS